MTGANQDIWVVTVPGGYRVGPWEVTEGIATGSWASVYAARLVDAAPAGPNRLPDQAALKFLPTGMLTPRQVRHLAETAEREARARERLQHPRLVRTYQILTVDDPASPELDGCVVLVMERAVSTLRHVLDRSSGRPVPQAPRLIAEIGAGLAHMHAAGWVHGDLKPSNVLLMADGSVRLTDFGMTAELEGTHAYLPPAGSADYLPPEVRAERLTARGRPVRTTADLWAFGMVMYQLLTGTWPFPGDTPRARAAAAAAYVTGRTPLAGLASLPAGWQDLVTDCLAPDHARRRVHDIATVVQRVRALGDGSSRHRRPGRRKIIALSIAGTALLTGTPVALLQHSWAQPARQATDAQFGVRWLRPDAGIPPRYRRLIVAAGTSCQEPGLSPALIAAILKVQSNFDPNLSDPGKDEFGIARWTPRVLRYHLPVDQRGQIPRPPFPPGVSIPAVGEFICRYLPELAAVPGDRGLLIAAVFEFGGTRVQQARGVPPVARHFVEQVNYYRARYDPQRTPPTTPPP